jgi:hypothetical protein
MYRSLEGMALVKMNVLERGTTVWLSLSAMKEPIILIVPVRLLATDWRWWNSRESKRRYISDPICSPKP